MRGSVKERDNEAHMTIGAEDEGRHLGASGSNKVIHRTIKRDVQ